MFFNARPGPFFLVALLIGAAVSAQQNNPPAQPNNGRIYLDVVVTPKSGPPVADLQQQDFTLLDNNVPQTITSFKDVNGRQAPMEIVLVIDAVNTTYLNVTYERTEADKFLRAEEGRLAYPVALAFVTDQGAQITGFSVDGNALGAALDREDSALRTVGRSEGFWGDVERWQLSLRALSQIVATVTPQTGRKIVLWISPGWPFLSGPHTDLDSKQQRRTFSDLADLSTRMLRGRVTLYSIDPLGPGESLLRSSYYEAFLRGVDKPSQVQAGNLGLQVLAIRSGGLALNSSKEVTKALQECLADTVPYYEISFDPAPAERPDEYHQIEIRLAQHGLAARTYQGYYAQPSPRN